MSRRSVMGVVSGALAAGAVGMVGMSAVQAAPAPMSPSDQARAGVTVVYDCGGDTQQRPATITLACADANHMLTGLRWTGWGTAKATATGTARINTCTPSCAEGKMASYRVKVRLDQLRNGEASATYRRMLVQTVGTPGDGIPGKELYKLTGNGPVFVR